MAYVNRGQLQKGRQYLQHSLREELSSKTLTQLAMVAERSSDLTKADDYYRRALNEVGRKTHDDSARRAELLERLGDVARRLRKDSEATRLYQRALATWDQLRSVLQGRKRAALQVRRGVLLGRLGQHANSIEAFEQGIHDAPDWLQVYAGVLAYLVVAEPNLSFATQVFYRVQRQLSLEPEWKVYFALWVGVIAVRAHGSLDAEVTELVDDLAKRTSSSWWRRLAQFGAGKLSYGELRGLARDPGQLAEAHFYAGAQRLGKNDNTEALRFFEKVMQSQMVSFYEFAMAQEFIAQAR